MNPQKLATSVILLSLLAGCTVGPNYVARDAATPANWHDPAALIGSGGKLTLSNVADPEPQWWKNFHDPVLDDLIGRATSGNLDLKIAVQRIAEARYDEVSTAAAGLPSLSGSSSYTRQQSGLDALLGQVGSLLPDKPTQPPPAFGLYEGALDASWELDLFGKVRRSVEAAGAESIAVAADHDDSLVSLEAEVAQTYAKLRAAQASRDAAAADISAEEELLQLTRDRSRHGLTSDLDVKNAAAQLASSQADEPQYEQQVTTYLNGLAVLLGQPPGALDTELSKAQPIPQPDELPLSIGLPSGLARRRPDIRAAEARLHEQTADVGVAVAQLYPDISLTGDVGQQSQKIGNLSRSYNSIYSFGPSLSLPLFQGGKLRANVNQAKAEQVEALLTYQKTVLSALQDVENALASYRTDQRRLKALQIETDANHAAVEISLDRYRHGLSNYLDVLTSRNTLIQTSQQVIQSQLAVSNDLVTLYKALGGGWENGESAAIAGANGRTSEAGAHGAAL